MSKKTINIAIDGPSSAGKSTIAKALAQKLSFVYVDTGALYRACAYHAISNYINIKDPDAIQKMLTDLNLTLSYKNGVQKVIVNGKDVTSFIRTPEISMGASDISKLPCVRSFLLDTQRSIAANNNVIMDGRDIGTVILPDADYKFFLTADHSIRVQRRYDELISEGNDISFKDVFDDMVQRDYNDSHREIAPLKMNESYILIDSSSLTIEEVVNLALSYITPDIKPKPIIKISKNAHNTTDVVIYNLPNDELRKWFAMIDIWNSKGYDRFSDGGCYFELPQEMYNIIPKLRFIFEFGFKIEKQ